MEPNIEEIAGLMDSVMQNDPIFNPEGAAKKPKDDSQIFNCMSFWYPRVEELGINSPKTVLINLNEAMVIHLGLGHITEKLEYQANLNNILDKKREEAGIEYPLFMRTGHHSHKHDYKNCCIVNNKDDFYTKIFNTVSYILGNDRMNQMRYDIIALRELIPNDVPETAFNGLPIVPERRYFINNRSIVCHHPYWPHEALEGQIENPENVLTKVNTESEEELKFLTTQTLKIADIFNGFWSVDWMYSNVNKKWYLIDMARGYESYHWKECENYEYFRAEFKAFSKSLMRRP